MVVVVAGFRRGCVVVDEQLGYPVPALLHAHQADLEGGHRVAHDVVRLVARDVDQQQVAVGLGGQARLRQPREEFALAVCDLDRQGGGGLGEVAGGGGAQQPAAVDDDDVVAGALELAEQGGLRGKQVSPFLLAAMVEQTGGLSLEVNLAIAANNVAVAGEIAREWSALRA